MLTEPLPVTPASVDWQQRDERGELTPKWDRESTLEMLPVLLDFGVTTVRDLGGMGITQLAHAVQRGLLAGPRIVGMRSGEAGVGLGQPANGDGRHQRRHGDDPEEHDREPRDQRGL